jgi:HKD family nuclease
VSPGHTLVITRRVVEDWFGASIAERAAILDLIDVVKKQLDEELHAHGFNVGFNAGRAAGQTVLHLHVHVIPHFEGDMDDPRGGVRHVIPSRGNYLRDIEPLASGGEENPFARHVMPLFERANRIDILAAFVQESGLERIRSAVRLALSGGAHIRILTGDYLDITQASALETLLDWEQASTAEGDAESMGLLEAAVVEVERLPSPVRSFHPKAWRFESASFGVAFVGSSNLSRSALDTGIEWNLRVDRDRDSNAYIRVRDEFDALWVSARRLDAGWITDYAARARRSLLPLPPPRWRSSRCPYRQLLTPFRSRHSSVCASFVRRAIAEHTLFWRPVSARRGSLHSTLRSFDKNSVGDHVSCSLPTVASSCARLRRHTAASSTPLMRRRMWAGSLVTGAT